MMTEGNGDKQSTTDVLLNTFLINKKRYRVLLHHNEIVWEKENSKSEKTTIPIQDIITVKLKHCKIASRAKISNFFATNERNDISSASSSSNNDCSTVDTLSDKDYKFLNIYYAKQLKNSRKCNNLWRKSATTLYNSDNVIVKLWFETIKKLIDDQKRPKCILMFINPFGGRKQALQIYEKYAKPLMNLAGVDVNCIISQRHNQIRDIIMTQSVDSYDAICCVGGDGTFAEVFNGLIFRAIRDYNMDPLRPNFIPKPKTPIGIIPAGSTNTVAYCIHGTTDVRTAVIHIILGQTRGLDLSSFYNNNGLVRFYASVMSYGYLGDVALESENFRWMGPKRYDYSGFKKILSNGGYDGEITYLAQSDENEYSKTKCITECIQCLNAQEKCPDHMDPSLNYTNNYNLNIQENRMESNVTMSSNHEWKNVKGKFFMISSANICCASSRSLNGLSPYCHLGDGYVDIVLVRHTNIINNIRLLLTLVDRNGDIANLPFVEIYRTRKFYFRTQKSSDEDASLAGSCQPISNPNDNKRTSQWNCDGEVIHESDIFISSHCQLIDVFMRGPSLQDDSEKSTKCNYFCNS